MGLILLEALLALVLLVAIVWWTMFSGRKGGELQAPEQNALPPKPPDPASGGAGGAEGPPAPPPASA